MQVFPGRHIPVSGPRLRSGTGGQFHYGQPSPLRVYRVLRLTTPGTRTKHAETPLQHSVHTPLRRPSSIAPPASTSAPLWPSPSVCDRLPRLAGKQGASCPACQAHCAAGAPPSAPLRPKPTAKAVGSEPPFRYFRSTVTPKSLPRLPSAYQQPPASCRPNITA